MAIATPPGRGGVGIVRIAGAAARDVAAALIDGAPVLEPRRATLVRLREPGGPPVDEALVTFFPAPHSYTTEDTVEISAHGSPALLAGLVRWAVASGARAAGPGEFTLRAFLNGRLDLVQAEAVGDLVAAVTPLQARVAFDQLDGTLTRAIGEIDRALFELCARLEASLDFPDEGYHFVEPAEVRSGLAAVARRIEALLDGAAGGRLIRAGARVAIVGRPNVGKSTLFNALVGTGRAIVSAEPGTTRDLVSETVDLGGVPILLVDTAGVRESEDAVEREGVARTRGAAGAADAVIVVCDGSAAPDAADEAVWALTAGGAGVLVLNKADLGLHAAWTGAGGWWAAAGVGSCRVSAQSGEGVGAVREALLATLGAAGGPGREWPLVTNARHEALLREALVVLARAVEGLPATGGAVSEELVLADVAAAREALEAICGRRTTDDVLRHIFERFCIGK